MYRWFSPYHMILSVASLRSEVPWGREAKCVHRALGVSWGVQDHSLTQVAGRRDEGGWLSGGQLVRHAPVPQLPCRQRLPLLPLPAACTSNKSAGVDCFARTSVFSLFS